MRSCSSAAPGSPGRTCPSASVRGRASTTGCESGRPSALGRGPSPCCSPRPTLRAISTGSSRSTPPSFVPASARLEPAKGAPAGEPDHHALGCSRGGLTTKIHLAADSRAVLWLSSLRLARLVTPPHSRGDDEGLGAPSGRQAADDASCGPRGQGVLIQCGPHPFAASCDPERAPSPWNQTANCKRLPKGRFVTIGVFHRSSGDGLLRVGWGSRRVLWQVRRMAASEARLGPFAPV